MAKQLNSVPGEKLGSNERSAAAHIDAAPLLVNRASGSGQVDTRSTSILHRSSSGLVGRKGRTEDVVAFESAVVAFFVDAADLLAVPKSVAAIYGICFASPEPLGFSEIHERLEISSGSISQGLRVLREVGALKVAEGPRLSVNGSELLGRSARPRERYEPDLELRKLITRFLEQRLDRQLHSGRSALQAIQKQIPGNSAGTKVLKARLKALQTWHDQARAVLPIVKTFLNLT